MSFSLRVALLVAFCTSSIAEVTEDFDLVTLSPVTENDLEEEESSPFSSPDSRDDLESDAQVYLNNGSCINHCGHFLYLGALSYSIQHAKCVSEMFRISQQHQVPRDNCVAQFCRDCITGGNYHRNCHTCCCSEHLVLSRIIEQEGEIEEEETIQVCNHLDLPTCATGLQRCTALQRLTNTSFSVENSCSVAVTKGIVDDCVEELMNNTSENITCKEFLLFHDDHSYKENADRYNVGMFHFCSKSHMHSLVCGALCRKGGPRVPVECQERKTNFCINFVRTTNISEIYKKYNLESEDEEELYSSSLLNFAGKLGVFTIGQSIKTVLDSVKGRRGKLTNQTAQNILDTFDVTFNESYYDQWRNLNNISTTRAMFGTMNEMLSMMIDSVVNRSNNQWVYRGTNMAIDVLRFQRGLETSTFSFPHADQVQNSSFLEDVQVNIPFTSPCSNNSDVDGCSVTIGISVIDNFAQYINDAINISDCVGTGSFHKTASSLLSVEVRNTKKTFRDFSKEPVKIHAMPKIFFNDSKYNYQAYFLDSKFCWNRSGVSTSVLSEGFLEVLSSHLSSFAILVSPTGEVPIKKNSREGIALALVTYIGCSISIVCLSLTLLVLLVFRKKLKKGVLLYIHINLTVSLLLAMVVFVAGVDNASFLKELCVFVAALIQYLFLCAFFWMLGEGVMLYLLIVRVFGNATKRWYLLIPICWGIPAIIVAVSAGVLHDDYTANNGTICWINATPSNPAIWTFLIPLILIVLINSIIFVVTIISIIRTREVGSSEWKQTRKGLFRMMVKSTLVLLPLLGVTWVLGLFAVVKNTSTFAWMFTIINSLQGLFIFLMHIVRNDYIMAETKKKLAGLKRYRKGSTFSIKSVDLNGKTTDYGFTNLSHRNNSSIKLSN